MLSRGYSPLCVAHLACPTIPLRAALRALYCSWATGSAPCHPRWTLGLVSAVPPKALAVLHPPYLPPQIHIKAGEIGHSCAQTQAHPSGLPTETGLGSPHKRHQLPGVMASDCPRPASQARGALGVAQRCRLGRRWPGEPLHLFCPWTPEAPVPAYSPGDMRREPRAARR